MPYIFSNINQENGSTKNSLSSCPEAKPANLVLALGWVTRSQGSQSLSKSCFHPPEVQFAHTTWALDLQSESGATGRYLVSGLKAFHFPSYVLHQLWVEELWAALVIWLKEGECNPNSCCSRLRVLMLLCSPNLLLPGFLQKRRIQRTWERGELDPVGLRHGYQQVLAGVTAWLLLILKRRAGSNQDD